MKDSQYFPCITTKVKQYNEKVSRQNNIVDRL